MLSENYDLPAYLRQWWRRFELSETDYMPPPSEHVGLITQAQYWEEYRFQKRIKYYSKYPTRSIQNQLPISTWNKEWDNHYGTMVKRTIHLLNRMIIAKPNANPILRLRRPREYY